MVYNRLTRINIPFFHFMNNISQNNKYLNFINKTNLIFLMYKIPHNLYSNNLIFLNKAIMNRVNHLLIINKNLLISA